MKKNHTKNKRKTTVPLRTIKDIVESDELNMGRFFHHLDLNIRKERRGLERLKMKIIRKIYPVVYNKACLNNNLLPKYTHTYIHTYIHINFHIYIYIYIMSCCELRPSSLTSLAIRLNRPSLRAGLLRYVLYQHRAAVDML